MAKKTLYKTVITMEVLSDEPIDENLELGDIVNECDNGSFSGIYIAKIINKPIKGIKAVRECHNQGTDIDFFQMDEKGNETNDWY